MAGKGRAPPQAGGDIVRVGGLAPQSRQHLGADALDRILVEARRIEREAHQLKAFVLALAQHPQRAAQLIAAGAKIQLDRVFSSRCWKAVASRSPAPSSSRPAAM